jgi:SAM-dependent methyltransferase
MATESIKQTIPACRFCNSDPSTQSVEGAFVYGGKSDQHFWKCQSCEMIYLYPTLSEEEEERLYNTEFEKYMAKRAGKDMDWSGPEKHFQSNQREVARRMPFLEPYLPNVKTVLELGCSSGFMLSALKDKNKLTFGVDPSGNFTDFVRRKGIAVYPSLEELKKDKPQQGFDLLIHYFVFEHVRKPVEFIQDMMPLLNPGGKMIFEVPCVTDPLIEMYRTKAFDEFYWSVVHHWYFNKNSLTRVLEKTGYTFQLYPEQRYDLSNHITWMLTGKPGGMGKFSHIFGSELDQLYKERLKANWICDTIIAVVSK